MPQPHLAEGERRRDAPATTTSHAASSPTPPARAGPRPTAMTGLGEENSVVQQVGELQDALVLRARCPPPPTRSMPEQKTRPVWSSTSTRTASSARASLDRTPQLRPHRPGQGIAVAGGVQGQPRPRPARRSPAARGREESHPGSCRSPPRRAAHWEQMDTALPLLPAPPAAPFALPASARDGLATTPFGMYVHVPFCATRCGYCDFNTYTATELGGGASAPSTPTRRSPRSPGRRGTRAGLARVSQCSSAAVRRRCCRPTTSSVLDAVRELGWRTTSR